MYTKVILVLTTEFQEITIILKGVWFIEVAEITKHSCPFTSVVFNFQLIRYLNQYLFYGVILEPDEYANDKA